MSQPTKLTQFAREHRRAGNEVEVLLWSRLRARRLGGFKFRRQFPIGSYIVDFCCLEKKLMIELDGSQHQDQRNQDENRSAYLMRSGYQVIRFWNNEVLQQTFRTCQRILEVLQNEGHGDPSPSSLP